jgi:hypothetical protein
MRRYDSKYQIISGSFMNHVLVYVGLLNNDYYSLSIISVGVLWIGGSITNLVIPNYSSLCWDNDDVDEEDGTKK